MDVCLVPVSANSYECYYEAPEQEVVEVPDAAPGFFGRLRRSFNAQLQDAERARHEPPADEPTTFLGRWQKRSMRWIAERIAEQRLLWHLRKADAATLHTASDLPNDKADGIMRGTLKREADHHRNRLMLHSIALIIAIPVAVLPGPNVLGYLFTFTVVGHFLAWRGAVRGLHVIAWTICPNPALEDLRRAFSLDDTARHRVIHDVAHRLHLPKMARFVEQMAAPTA